MGNGSFYGNAVNGEGFIFKEIWDGLDGAVVGDDIGGS